MNESPRATRSLKYHFLLAWARFHQFPRTFITANLLLFVAWAILELAVISLRGTGIVANILLHLIFLWFFSGMMAGFYHMAVDALAGHEPRIRSIVEHMNRGIPLFLAIVFYVIAVAIGLLLLIVPGVIVAVRLALVGPAVALERNSALAGVISARALSRGRFRLLGRFALLCLGLQIAGAALVGMGLLITVPVSILAGSSLYSSLREANPG